MRISDWSSDVCSSDLGWLKVKRPMMKFSRPALAALSLLAMLSGCGVFGGSEDPATPTVGNRTPILSRIVNAVEADPSLADVTGVLPPAQAIGRASCRERVCQYVKISGVAVSCK